MTNLEIVHPLILGFPQGTPFFVLNAFLAMGCTVALSALILRSPRHLARLALLMAGALNLLFQWPLALYSMQIERSLSDSIFFAISLHMTVIACVAWVAIVPGLAATDSQHEENLGKRIAWPSGLLVVFLCIFLMFMPYYCTALFALLFDPSNTLLAREVTIKLAGSTITTSSYGALANAAAPATAGLAIVLLLHSLESRRLVAASAWLLLMGACFAAVLIGGAKGLLVPLVIVVAFAATGSFRSLWLKFAAVALSVVCLAGLLASFEVLRERGGREIPYDFVGCIVELGTVDQGRDLLQSMANGGLTMSALQIAALMEGLENAGGKELPPLAAPAHVAPSSARAATYLGAIAYRAFVTPIQGAAWHYLYVEENGSPGIGTLPLALKILGYSTDATTLVYQKYGVIFSGGDATSTSTTPTSFVFAYPAYFGWIGLAVSVVSILLLDTVSAFALKRVGPAILSVGAGLLAVICYNSLTSDLFSVLISHGGAVALFLILVWGGGAFRTGWRADASDKTSIPISSGQRE